MNKPTVQDIFLKFYSEYLEKYTPSAEQSKVSNAIMNCKTSRMGETGVALCVRLFLKKSGWICERKMF